MLLKDKIKHHKGLLDELKDIELLEYKENESNYLVDYLYGESDVHSDIEDYLNKEDLNDEWIIFYRCLIKREIINKNQYYKLKDIGNNIFLMRDKVDLDKWQSSLDKLTSDELEKDLEDILIKIKAMINEKGKNINDTNGLFTCDEVRNSFKKHLKKYIESKETKDEKYDRAIFDLDSFLKAASNGKQIQFTKTDFWNDILKINKTKIADIQKKYKGSNK